MEDQVCCYLFHVNAFRRMGWMLVHSAALLFFLGYLPVVTSAQQLTATATLVFDGVTVVDVERGKLVPDQRVVVGGNRIQAVGNSLAVPLPRGAQVVDARGKYLIPGLWDMHVHPALVNAEKFATGIAFPLYVANGVTGVRDAGASLPLTTLVAWKREIAAGSRVGPRYLVSGPFIGTDNGQTTVALRGGAYLGVPLMAAGRVVDSLKAAGADFIKLKFASPETYFAVAAEARRIGLPFGGHDPDPTVDGRILSDSGASFLDHSPYLPDSVCMGASLPDSLAAAQCRVVGDQFRRNGTWAVLTSIFPRVWPALDYEHARRFIPDSVLREAASHGGGGLERLRQRAEAAGGRLPTSTADWRAALAQNPLLAHFTSAPRQRVLRHLPILAGTDGGSLSLTPFVLSLPGFGLHEILVSYVLGGMTPLAALQTATLNPALALQATDSLGTVAAGKLADLVLLDADPLVDIWNTTKIWAVVTNGRYFDRSALDQLLEQAERTAHR